MFRAYVDEAGGRHISAKSDRHFVLSAVLVHEDWNDRVREQFAELKTSLGRHPDHVLHFSQLKKPRRVVASKAIAGLKIAMVTNVIICKQTLGEDSPAGKETFIANADPMYLWALRLLLERISWYARDVQKQDVIATFSHVRNLDPTKLHKYRAALEGAPAEKDVRIDWARFADHPFRVRSPKDVDLLQLADLTASSVYQAVEPGKDGPAYLQAYKHKLYKRKPITSYGLTVFPKRHGAEGGTLNWLQTL